MPPLLHLKNYVVDSISLWLMACQVVLNKQLCWLKRSGEKYKAQYSAVYKTTIIKARPTKGAPQVFISFSVCLP